MSLSEYQIFSRTTAIYPKETALEYLSLGLTSEAGEVAGKVKKKLRDNFFDPVAVIDELGDVLWYATRLCDEMGFTIEDCFAINKRKLEDRQCRGKLSGSGDTR